MSKTETDYSYNADDEIESSSPSSQSANIPKSEWDKYIDSLDQERMNQIIEYAKQSKYNIDGQEYVRKKIKVREFNELERLRGKLTKEKDPVKATDLLIDVYAKCAELYLGVDKDTFEEMDWEITKPILDGCSYRSVRGIPNSPKGFKGSGGIT